MPGMQGSKVKLLYLMEILWLYTDEEHILSANEICQKLEEYGSRAERKSVYTDIEALRTFGFNIVNARTPKRGYFLASRMFEPAEIRILMDAVREAAFIPAVRKTTLYKKVGSLTSERQAHLIEKQMLPDDERVPDEKELCYKINVLHAALREEKQVEFLRISRDIQAHYSSRCWEEVCKVNPHALVCDKGRYSLIYSSTDLSEVRRVRLDRIKNLKLLGDSVTGIPTEYAHDEGFDVRKFCCGEIAETVAESANVELCCSASVLEDILDRFGLDVPIKHAPDNQFHVKTQVALSADLIAWVMSFGTDIRIEAPVDLAAAVCQKASEIASLYCCVRAG